MKRLATSGALPRFIGANAVIAPSPDGDTGRWRTRYLAVPMPLR